MLGGYHDTVHIPVDGIYLAGELTIPTGSQTIIVFAHGAGSSRLSPRNREVARTLQGNGFATLLFDLLTEPEDLYYYNRFAIDLLTERLVAATRWLIRFPPAKDAGIAYFGGSTGAAAALMAAADLTEVQAVVSRGGRPDLAMRDLPKVKAPTLLIVGGADQQVLQLNQTALEELRCQKRLEIVPGATHLFEEPGALDAVSRLAVAWFKAHTGQQRSG